jgi:DNA-binding PucR family transcriptional regulator
VHRNTVSGRLDRIRARGVEFDDPDHRLAVHVACFTSLGSLRPTSEATGELADRNQQLRQ